MSNKSNKQHLCRDRMLKVLYSSIIPDRTVSIRNHNISFLGSIHSIMHLYLDKSYIRVGHLYFLTGIKAYDSIASVAKYTT